MWRMISRGKGFDSQRFPFARCPQYQAGSTPPPFIPPLGYCISTNGDGEYRTDTEVWDSYEHIRVLDLKSGTYQLDYWYDWQTFSPVWDLRTRIIVDEGKAEEQTVFDQYQNSNTKVNNSGGHLALTIATDGDHKIDLQLKVAGNGYESKSALAICDSDNSTSSASSSNTTWSTYAAIATPDASTATSYQLDYWTDHQPDENNEIGIRIIIDEGEPSEDIAADFISEIGEGKVNIFGGHLAISLQGPHTISLQFRRESGSGSVEILRGGIAITNLTAANIYYPLEDVAILRGTLSLTNLEPII